MIDLHHAQPERVRAFDHTSLASYRAGASEGSPLMLANGLGVQLPPWEAALAEIARHRPILSWDQRGLHLSEAPRSERIDAGAQAEDLLAVADHHGAERFDLVGWSVGARVAAEAAIRAPERVGKLVLVCGGKGRGLRRLLRAEPAAAMAPLAGLLKHFTGLLEGPFRSITSRPEIAGLVRQSGLIGPTADVPALVEILQGLAGCDGRTWLATYESLARDADPNLGAIEAPTLVIAGERDPFTSTALMREIAAAIPGAELVVYERGTHYLPIEFPERLGADLQAFFA